MPPVAMEDLPTVTMPQTRTQHNVSGTANTVLMSETYTKTLTVTQRLLHTRSSHKSDPERLGLILAQSIYRDCDPVSSSMGRSDSNVLFDQVLNSRAKSRGGGATSGNSKEKRFLCMFCNKGFGCLQKVEFHQRVHTGENPFSCTQCDKRFSRQDHLKRHQRVDSPDITS
ncbi:zinc finger protein 184-like isoform X1 [Oncorhynchus mykiss]|uniref:zinc finger protein 184-like isoform X1 n=1 Tax=Oncorhynchus mykiss TaxID=8022 RepID=UPI001877BA76|nr:zinc finger protein 184-like isoform X1 [Oncorhynchus mykiss]